MNLTEIVDVQCEIIKMQSELVKKMCAEIGQQNAFAEEIKRIEALKEKNRGTVGGNIDYQKIARKIVLDYTNEHIDKTDHVQITLDDVFIVWFCKTLQNWKALVSTTLPDGMYYEVTYNGDKKEVYLDAYKKFENRKIDKFPN